MLLDERIEELLPDAVRLAERLVAQPSVLGGEAGALAVLEAAWTGRGFLCEHLAIPADIGDHPAAGVPLLPSAGRYDLVGRRGPADGAPSLLLNGHIDVVPASDVAAWTHPPFVPTLADGWLYGRGAADMKCGFAAGLLAVRALDDAEPGWLGAGTLTMVAAVEEECTGNGTLASVLAGITADAALLLEPTDLEVLAAGIGIVWVEIEVDGRAGHADASQPTVNPVLVAQPILTALRELEERLNEPHESGRDVDPVFAEVPRPYAVNVGTFHAGDWASSTASTARMEVRVGHPRKWTAIQALQEVEAALGAAADADPWLATHPPRVRLSGYRAEGFAQPLEGALYERLVAAHADVFGGPPALAAMASTTDARAYVNQAGMPALAYGPRTRGMHGVDEAVEVASIADTARVVARLLRAWFASAR